MSALAQAWMGVETVAGNGTEIEVEKEVAVDDPGAAEDPNLLRSSRDHERSHIPGRPMGVIEQHWEFLCLLARSQSKHLSSSPAQRHDYLFSSVSSVLVASQRSFVPLWHIFYTAPQGFLDLARISPLIRDMPHKRGVAWDHLGRVVLYPAHWECRQ